MRTIFFAIILSMAGTSARADAIAVFELGIGIRSCATWLATPASENAGANWILGYWSGANFGAGHSDGPSGVGASTDGAGLIGEMKKRCTENPASTVSGELSKLYVEFSDKGL